MLDIAEANSGLRWGEYDQAMTLLAAVNERHPDGPFVSEAIDWLGIAASLNSHDNDDMDASWAEIQERSPDSIGARRIP